MSKPSTLSIRDALAGRHVLLTGGSGFVGKVWLSMALTRLPEIERIYVFMRPKALVPARQRFEKMLNTSAAFRPLHERFGALLSEYIAERVEVLEGEMSAPDLGLEPSVLRRLRRDLDVVVHCAGLVDFNPDLRKAIDSNVDGTMRVADFVESCDRASLLHISTCYVVGRRNGYVEETLQRDYNPKGTPFSADAELVDARARIETIMRAHSGDAFTRGLREQVLRTLHDQGRNEPSTHLVETLTRKKQREQLKQALSDEGMERAQRLGWPNTYTYTKSLAESLLAKRSHRLRFAVLRPSIVESALEFPEPGWNESFNGSAPLTYVMGSWLPTVPARSDAPFDVIPVDLVCRAMTQAAAALVVARHKPVYHVGTSDKNRINVGRAAELISLAHRRYLRHDHRSRAERLLKSRLDSVLVRQGHVLSVDTSRSLLRGVDEAIDLLPRKLQKKASGLLRRVRDADEKCSEIEKLFELYMPFMYDGFYVFKSDALDDQPVLEPEFRWSPTCFEWRSYWLDIHVPGLRRWTFPLIEGKRPERYRAEYPVRLAAPQSSHAPTDALHTENSVTLASPSEAS